ncbi:hypothetical protein DERP_009936 [Dermatophagoides pteronyssinus]|uniref:Uncharacterized protein n=1 Tax=Dermatophagoides pteronyssinus TaxID=6956 RepID=A0ABQ8J1Z7_DERPT|nr:hypothetical protein DERP_009936 [Dermatophagoides pteronyssinus]
MEEKYQNQKAEYFWIPIRPVEADHDDHHHQIKEKYVHFEYHHMNFDPLKYIVYFYDPNNIMDHLLLHLLIHFHLCFFKGILEGKIEKDFKKTSSLKLPFQRNVSPVRSRK